MKKTRTKKEKLGLFLQIMLPILITQIGMFSMTFFDTVMTGNFSADDLAGVGIGSSIWTPVYTGLGGILVAITPIVSQQIGGGNKKDVPFTITQGSYLSIIMAVLIFAGGYLSLNPILDTMSLEPKVHDVAYDYLAALSTGIIPLFLYSALRYFIDALGQTRISMFITLLALPINVLFNYMLIFGKFGFPALGGVGAGYATSITYWVILAIAVFVIMKVHPFREYNVFRKVIPFSFRENMNILKIGVPIGLSIFFETSIFSAVTLLMSKYDTITIASHQTALNFASFLYMMPLSISMALTIVVGYEVGAKRYRDAKQYARLGTILAVSFAGLSAVFLYFFRTDVAGLYSKDAEVIQLTANFLILALFFQFSDAVMAPIQGALRGYKDVNVTFVLSFASFWLVGLPVGFIFSEYTGMGPYGYWIGLIAGLALGAVSLAFRLLYIQRKVQASPGK